MWLCTVLLQLLPSLHKLAYPCQVRHFFTAAERCSSMYYIVDFQLIHMVEHFTICTCRLSLCRMVFPESSLIGSVVHAQQSTSAMTYTLNLRQRSSNFSAFNCSLALCWFEHAPSTKPPLRPPAPILHSPHFPTNPHPLSPCAPIPLPQCPNLNPPHMYHYAHYAVSSDCRM